MRIAASALCALALAAAPLLATTLRPMDLGELAREASVIVHARVAEVRPEWVRGGRQIDSVVIVEALTVFKGEPGRRLAFAVPGGQIGEYRTVVPGAPELGPGAEVVLFLAPSGASRATSLVGLAQGVLPVSLDAAGARRVRAPFLVPGLQDAHLPVRLSLTLPELAERLARFEAAGRARGGR